MRDGLSLTTWGIDSFAYAESWDETNQRYVGLQANRIISITAESTGLLATAEVAEKQMELERPESKPGATTTLPGVTGADPKTVPGVPGSTTVPGKPAEPAKPTRFFGSVKIDAARMNRDAATISNEVVQHLVSQLGAEVEITIEVQAKIPQGVPDNVVRTVTENCRTLKFTDHGFEKE